MGQWGRDPPQGMGEGRGGVREGPTTMPSSWSCFDCTQPVILKSIRSVSSKKGQFVSRNVMNNTSVIRRLRSAGLTWVRV